MKGLLKRLLLLIAAVILVGFSYTFAPDRLEDKLRNGDIIFQETASAQSKAIQLATHSRYSHVGIVYFRKGKPVVLEAVQPVRISSLSSFINRSVGGHYVVKRLKTAETVLTSAVLAKMEKAGRQMVGKNYDWAFG